MIIDNINSFISRISDVFLIGRNRTRIVLGTDRKTTVDSGYGDGGQNDAESGTIDIVAGYKPDNRNVDYAEDKSRILLSGKTDPDQYFEINKGTDVTGEPAIVVSSDNVYLKSNKNFKIIGNNYYLIIDENGNLELSVNGNCKIISNNIILGQEDSAKEPAWSTSVRGELQKISQTLLSLTVTAPPAGGPCVILYGTGPYQPPVTDSALGATNTKIS